MVATFGRLKSGNFYDGTPRYREYARVYEPNKSIQTFSICYSGVGSADSEITEYHTTEEVETYLKKCGFIKVD